MARTTANTSRLAAVRPATARLRGQPGLDEHPVLQCGADRTAAGRDLRQRVARELRADHRRPRRPAHRQVLERPQAREGERLQAGHRGQPPRGELVEVVPRAEDIDQARRDEVQRDCGDRQPEHGPAQPTARGRLGSRPALDLVLDIRPLIDRALYAVADLAHVGDPRARLGERGSPRQGDARSPRRRQGRLHGRRRAMRFASADASARRSSTASRAWRATSSRSRRFFTGRSATSRSCTG